MAVANPADLPVLVVEDNPGAAELARRALGRLGVTAVLAGDVEEALAELSRMAFSAVLLDYRLPKGDAWEVLEAAQAATPKIPVIVVTAMGDERVAAEAIRRGAADYLIKGEDLQTDLTESLERVFSEHEMERDKALLAAIVDSSEDAILCVALDGTVLTWNVGAEKIFGYAREEIVGRPVWTLYPPEASDQFPGLVALAEEGGVRNLVAERLRKDGSRITVSLTVSPLRNPHGRLIGTSSILRDITDQKRREREREAILAVSSALRGAQNQEHIMSVVLDEVQQFLRAAGAGFALHDRRTSETVVALACGVWAPLNGLRLPPGTGIAHQVITSGKAFVTSDLAAEPSFTARNVVDPLPAAAACVPLVAHDENLGGLWANRNEPFSAADVRLLQAIADMAATALHRQTLHEETNRRLHRLAALRSVDLAITSSLDLRRTLSILLEQVMNQLDLDAAAVLLLEAQTQTLRYAAGRGFRTRVIERTALRLGEGAAGAAALGRRTELLDAAMVRHSLAESEGFVFSCIVPLIAKGAIKGVLEGHHRQPRQPDPEWVEFLETLAGQAAIAIDNAALFDSLQRSNVELSLAYDTTIEGWSSALDLRDRETQGHSARVTEMTLRLAREMGLAEDELVQVRRGALLHDIGKMGIPDAILLKPGPLTAEEWNVMRRHPALAHEMLSPIAYLRSALDIPFCHHEKWDGTGYPRGLKGDEIPLAARIFAVADVWDALRSDRPYRPAWPAEKVRRHIEEQAGLHFDPAVVALFLQLDAPASAV